MSPDMEITVLSELRDKLLADLAQRDAEIGRLRAALYDARRGRDSLSNCNHVDAMGACSPCWVKFHDAMDAVDDALKEVKP